MIRFIEKTDNHSYRLAGDTLPLLIDEALTYVVMHKREEYRERLIWDIDYQGWAEILPKDGVFGRMCVYYDPLGDVSTEALQNLSDVYLIAGHWGVFLPGNRDNGKEA